MKQEIIVLSGDPFVVEIARSVTGEGFAEIFEADNGLESACADAVIRKADALLFAGTEEDVKLAKRIFGSFGQAPTVFVLAENDEELAHLHELGSSVCIPLSRRSDAAGSARFIVTNLKIIAERRMESERKALSVYVTNLLMKGRINAGHSGFSLLRDAIVYCVENRSCTAALGKEVYREIARNNSMTPASVERNIRTSIDRCWKLDPEHFCAGFFGSPSTALREKPTAKEFISTLAERVALEFG